MSSRLAPGLALLALSACGRPESLTTTEPASTSSPDDTSTSENPDPSDVSDPGPTTSGTTAGDDTTGGSAPTTVDPSTTDPSTTDPTADPSTTTGTNPDACAATADCDGGFCWFDYVDRTPAPSDFTCHDVCVDDMGGGNAESAWCLDAGSCCSADSACNPMGYCVPAGETTGGDTDTDTDTDGEIDAMLAIQNLSVFGNCKPVPPSDPVAVTWDLDIDNTLGAADVTATVFKAMLVYTPGDEQFVQQIKVAPSMLGPVPAAMLVSTPMSKTSVLNDLPMDCDRCGDMVRLDLTFKIDGVEVPVTAEATMECAL